MVFYFAYGRGGNVMKLETPHFGELDIEETEMYVFKQGIPGFEQLSKFALLEIEPGSPFRLLQSVDELEISFVVADPFMFYKDYEWELSESAQQELQLDKVEDIEVRSIVTIHSDLHKATINLLAPLVFNVRARLGKQHILHNSGYGSAQPLLPSGTSAASAE
jgi:flagellar assembly factor FliW